ncbi:transcription factor IIIB 90 kDa subunit [Elysia marginata]|uniref:Transcription factor IIIB 90 kDa subunit n=1 Tax=Elysia marginata TaxID=1093978 RepID=A0AAV4HQ15_9GAST|nr:transcription factor IIIB 90 kDa subunit [Elysia marginata]
MPLYTVKGTEISSPSVPDSSNRTVHGVKHSLQGSSPCGSRHMRDWERWSTQTKRLPPLKIRDHVRIQIYIRPNPLKRDNTERSIEVRLDQYVVKVDGSGRVTSRNRKFLRQYSPVIPYPPSKSIAVDIPMISLLLPPPPRLPLDFPHPPNPPRPLYPPDLQPPPPGRQYHNTTYIARRHKVHNYHTTSSTLKDCTPGLRPHPKLVMGAAPLHNRTAHRAALTNQDAQATLLRAPGLRHLITQH